MYKLRLAQVQARKWSVSRLRSGQTAGKRVFDIQSEVKAEGKQESG